MGIYRRGKVWWIRFTVCGQEIRESATTGSRHVALAYERKRREEIGMLSRGGKAPYPFDDAMLDLIDSHFPSLKPNSVRRYLISARALTRIFEGMFLHRIDGTALFQFEMQRRSEGVKPATIRRDLACLSVVFGQAIDAGHVEINPVPAYMRRRAKRGGLRESPPRTRYLTLEEEVSLLSHAPEYLRGMIIFAIDSGLRKEEQLSLTWRQVDLRRKEVTIFETKSGRARTVPLLDRSAQMLSQVPRHISSPYVFHSTRTGGRYQRLLYGLRGASRRAGIEPLTWHDLRRTCGCRLLQEYGLSMVLVAKWLGHTTTAITESTYAFLGSDSLREAVRVGTKGGTGTEDYESSFW